MRFLLDANLPRGTVAAVIVVDVRRIPDRMEDRTRPARASTGVSVFTRARVFLLFGTPGSPSTPLET